MKIYDYQWSITVMQQFHHSCPRVGLLHNLLIQLARRRGLILTEGDLLEAIIRIIRVPAIGKYAWRDYKVIAKRTPFDLEEVSRLLSNLRLSSQLAKEEMAQMEFDFSETQLIYQEKT